MTKHRFHHIVIGACLGFLIGELLLSGRLAVALLALIGGFLGSDIEGEIK